MIRGLSGQGYGLDDLLEASGIPRSTYYYNLRREPRATRRELWPKVEEIFRRTANGCGYRQVTMCLRAEDGVRISGKTVLKMMREMGLRCGIRRETEYHRYNSYRGKVGRTFENLLGRDFRAGRPWEKMGTDVTEFNLGFGKAYLAPVLDFCTDEVVAWSISEHPDMAQQREMLGMLLGRKPEGARPILTSDMGWQYQSDWYCATVAGAGFVQSMSRKGNCLDNACTEGFFGHLKDEFFRHQKWDSFESFKRDLDGYIRHWNTRRRQIGLEGMTPAEYRNHALGDAA